MNKEKLLNLSIEAHRRMINRYQNSRDNGSFYSRDEIKVFEYLIADHFEAIKELKEILK